MTNDEIINAIVKKVLEAWEEKKKPTNGATPYETWKNYWQKKNDVINIPKLPKISKETYEAMTKFGFKLMFIPEIEESKYPSSFAKPNWGQYLNVGDIKRLPLEGKWVLVETIASCDYTDPKGYGNGSDPLAAALGMETRFNKSWNDLHEAGFKKRLGKLLGVSPRSVRNPSAEERNLIGNVFLDLRTETGEVLPDLGSTNSWEWCENAFGSVDRLVAGDRGDGGVSAVSSDWSYGRYDGLAFRVLVVL